MTEFEIAKLQLKAGDVLVCRVTQKVDYATRERIYNELSKMLPSGVRPLVIDSSIELSVLTADEIEQRKAA